MTRRSKNTPERIEKPWGFEWIYHEETNHVVKRLLILQGQRISLQRHAQRTEHWTVVRGHGLLELAAFSDGDVEFNILLQPGTQVTIPANLWHRAECKSEGDALEILEVQYGFCDPEDIERREDDYGRA